MDEEMKKEILATIDRFQDIHGWQQQESRNALVCEIRDRVEAVLAEQQRRQAPKEMDADESGKYALADTTPGACNWLNINDMKNMYAVVSVQATLPHAKEIIHFAWERLTGEQPADDVVQRMRDAVTGMRGMAAALAVAREGMVPASLQLTDVQWKWIEGESERLHDNPNDERDPELDFECKLFRSLLANRSQSEQQLSSMYSLEQVETAILGDFIFPTESRAQEFAARVRARLTAKQQPTEQEPAKWVTINYHPDYMGSSAKMCGLCGALVSYEFAHTNWHNNLLAALGKGGK